MSKLNYYVYTDIDCMHYESLDEAIEKYNSIEMFALKDSVFLGIESEDISPTGGMCFDVLHRFFNDSILINDWLNHKDEDNVREIVKEIVTRIPTKYQFTSEILNGALIPFSTPWIRSGSGTMADNWSEAYISVYRFHKNSDNEFVSIGWKENNFDTIGNYQWQYPIVASYVGILNVKFTDELGVTHDIDIDPREYLANHGSRFSDIKDFE